MNQEEILTHVQNQNWKPVLKFLHLNKKEIKSDQLLQFASKVFESEFFRSLHQDENNIVYDYLEDLYLLNSGEFHVLENGNYEILVSELAKGSSGQAAFNYAKLFPDNPICKQIIETYTSSNYENEKTHSKMKISRQNWIGLYNRLFEVINNQSDQSTYFSGPRFINTLKEFDTYHPDYTQYIGLRNEQGKSTSRKIFFFDILMELHENTRKAFVNRILEMVEPFVPEQIIPIKALLGGEKPKKVVATPEFDSEVSNVFISYSWDDETHKKWVLELANKLMKEGINVLLDRYELRLGKSLPHFVESSIKKADRIIIVFTPNYKLKAEKRAGGVGYEYSIMNAELYENQTQNDKVIPILRKGTKTESIPEFMQQYIHLDMTKNETFDNSFIDLKREINDEPEIVKPELGKKR